MRINESYRQSLYVTVGTVFNSVLGLLFYILVAQKLGVSGFGLFSLTLSLGLLASELGDLGVNAAIIKFGAKEDFHRIVSFALIHRLVIFSIIFLIFFLLNNLASAWIAIGLLLAYFSTQSLLARQKFAWQIGANVSGNVLRLILLTTTTISPVAVFFFGTILTFAVGLPLIIKNIKKYSLDWAFSQEVFRFSLPTAGSYSLASVAAKIDIPILYALAGPVSVGLYSSAQKLTSVFAQVLASIDSVFAPKFALKVPGAFKNYFLLTLIAGVGIICLIPVATPLISLIYGQKYLDAQNVLKIMMISYIPFFLSGPFLGKILYFYGKSSHVLIISTVNFLVSLVGFFFLVSLYKENGAALALVIVNTVGLALYVISNSLLSHKTN